MGKICPPTFSRLQRIHSVNRSGAETVRPAPAIRRGNRRGLGFNLLASALLLALWSTTPAQGDPIFRVLYNGVLTVLANGSVTQPFGVAVALDGTVYIADTYGQRIVRVTPSGTTAAFSISGITGALSYPTQVAVDSAGNLYITDYGNNRIVKSDPSGNGTVVSTQALTLSEPEGVAVDGSGDIFIADTLNNRIVEVTSSGTASVLTGTGSYLTSLSGPTGVATDLFGNLYIADYGNNRIVKVTTSGVESLLSTNGGLNQPQSVAVDNTGIVYIADQGNHRVTIDNQQTGDLYDLLFSEVDSELGSPSAIAVSAFGTVYVADSAGGKVNAFQVNHAEFGHVTLGSSGTPQTLNFVVGETATLTGVAIYTSGTQNLDFTIAANSGTPCTTGSNEITCTVNVQFTPISAGLRRGALVLSYTDGSLMVPLSGIGDAPVAALSPAVGSVLNAGSVSIGEPFQTAYDGVGNIYVTSYQNSTVLKIPAGGGSATAVTIPSLPTPSTLASPTGLAIDGAGNLFIADYNNSRLVEVTPSGTSKVIAVRGLSPGLSYPTTLAFDLAGRLWVDDYGSGRIIVLSPDIYDSGNFDGDGTVGFAVAYVYPLGVYRLGNDNSIGVSVDLTGNVYFTDQDTNPGQILKANPFGNVSPLSLPSITLNAPAVVTVDPQGNIYVGDTGNKRIIQLTTSGAVSVLNYSGPSFGPFAYGLAVDNSDNLLISDLYNDRLIAVNVGQSALTFPSTLVGSKSTTETTTVTNLGDLSLVFSANPTYTVNFSQDTTDENPCTSDTSLASGQSCDVPIVFSPQSVGSLSASVNVANNTQNVAGSTQQIAVSGTGTEPATTTTVTFAPTSPVYGQSVTIAATVSSGNGTPTGTVTINDLTTSTTLASNLTLISGVATVDTSTLSVGSHSIEALYTPIGTFQSSNGNRSVTIAKASTSTALSLSGNTLTATITAVAPGAGTPTGTVQFQNNSVNVGTPVALSGGTATLAVTPTPPYSFAAVYAGDTNFNGSSSSGPSQATVPTSTAVTASPSSSVYGQALTLTATVSASSGTPAGTVTFTDQTTSTTLASGVSLAAGTAGLTLSTLAVGSHTIQAVYTPSGNSFLTSSGTAAVTIGKSGTSTVLSYASGTVIATVTAAAPGSGIPTGSVQFFSGSMLVGSATLGQGTASFNTFAITGLTAVYGGDANFNGSTSVALALTMPSLSLSGSPNPSSMGQAVTFTLTVLSGSAAGGTAQFFDGVTPLGTAPVVGAQAIFSTSSLVPGSHAIMATYGGNSATWGQVVDGLAPTVTLSANPSTVAFGQAVTLTAQLGPAPPQGVALPTGQVLFRDAGADVGTAPVSGSAATLVLNNLAPGQHQLMAIYLGDKMWAAGHSAPMALTVGGASTSITLTPAVAAANLVMLTAAISSSAPALGTPTGNVQFVDTGKNSVLATAVLSGGVASASLTAPAVAGRPITAVYAGDANFAGSTSAPLAPMLNAAWNSGVNFAPDEIASLYGIGGLNGDTTATPPLTASLSGVTVTITDSTGAAYPALLYGVYASASQINFLIPGGTAAGPAIVTITLPGGGTFASVVNIGVTAPGVFTANSSGQGVYAGQVVYTQTNGTQSLASPSNPIDISGSSQVFLVLYGTGLRHADSVTATVNGVSVTVVYFGALQGSEGIDQVNLGPLPASLAGAGTATVAISADGQPANPVTVIIQ